jgi:hypothetical protein
MTETLGDYHSEDEKKKLRRVPKAVKIKRQVHLIALCPLA